MKKIVYKEVPSPKKSDNLIQVSLSDETMKERQEKVLDLIKKHNYDALVVYADIEHGRNFEYLTGFRTRFEESLLVYHKDGTAYLLLGNENTKMCAHSRIKANLIHQSYFSLPYQPMESENVEESLERAGIKKGMKVGLAGWKYFAYTDKKRQLFDAPYFIVDAIMNLIGDRNLLENACDIFIGAEEGVRLVNNANELAHYEFGAALAGNCMYDTVEAFEVGKSEMEIASHLEKYGQPNSLVTICSSGERFVNANLYPSEQKVQIGDRVSLSSSFKGGACCVAGYAVHNEDELPEGKQDFIEVLSKPYFNAITAWLTEIHIGMKGKEMYERMEELLPKEIFGWTLNPGHQVADEEWMTSTIYPGSEVELKSGMILQLDIIPKRDGYAGTGIETTIALADEKLRGEIEKQYPELHKRINRRREYLKDVIGIDLPEEVLPFSDLLAYSRPYLLSKNKALCWE